MLQAQIFVCLLACWLAPLAQSSAQEQSRLQGWATEGDGTIGGKGGPIHLVSNADEFAKALIEKSPKSIHIAGEIKLTKPVRIDSDSTIIGVGPGAKIIGGGLQLRRVCNIIIQNLVITEAPDAISVEESHHVWIDHCDLSRCRDGLVDIKRGSDFVTVSWNRFHDHHKTSLLGHSDKPAIGKIDRRRLRVTYHHNFFDGTKTRHPRVRFSESVHVFNNYFRNNEYGVASLMDAGVFVEANVFEDVEHPTLTIYGDSPDPGRLVAKDNLLIRSGNIETRGEVPLSVIKYSYTAEPAKDVFVSVPAQAGVRPATGDKKQ